MKGKEESEIWTFHHAAGGPKRTASWWLLYVCVLRCKLPIDYHYWFFFFQGGLFLPIIFFWLINIQDIYLQNIYLIKNWYSECIKNSQNCIIQKRTTQLTNRPKILPSTSPKNIKNSKYRRQIYTWKEAQHH